MKRNENRACDKIIKNWQSTGFVFFRKEQQPKPEEKTAWQENRIRRVGGQGG